MPIGCGCVQLNGGALCCRFCAECVIQAGGLRDASGPLRGLLLQVPVGASCPECRQKGVFAGAIELKKLGQAVALRCEPLHICRPNHSQLGN